MRYEEAMKYITEVGNFGSNYGLERTYKLLEYLDQCTSCSIKFALSNVLEMNGKSNDILKKWIEKRGYNVHHLNYTYGNCNYHKLDKTKNQTDEVLITNY